MDPDSMEFHMTALRRVWGLYMFSQRTRTRCAWRRLELVSW